MRQPDGTCWIESDRQGVHVIPQIPCWNFKLGRPRYIDHRNRRPRRGQTPPQCGEVGTDTSDAGGPPANNNLQRWELSQSVATWIG